jgi:hypothetical protein
MPAGSFVIGNSTANTFAVSSAASGSVIRCQTTSSISSITNLSVNDINFPADPSSGLRMVRLDTMSITKASGTASFRVWSGTSANNISSGGVLPTSSPDSYYQATTGLVYGALFTSSGSLSLYRSTFSGATIDLNPGIQSATGNLRATFSYQTLPYAPLNVFANANGNNITISWNSPSDLGGSPIQGYRVQMSVNGGTYQTIGASETENSANRVYIYSGFEGNSYRFRVAAITVMVGNLRIAENLPNATGPYSADSNSVTLIPIEPTTSTVPNVIGQNETTAKSFIENSGFVASKGVNITFGATLQNNGLVANQTPSGGSSLVIGATVTYNLYQFVDPTVTVPNTIGDTESQARLEIEVSGLVPSVSYSSDGATSNNNRTVKSQNPAPGTQVAASSTVSIVVYDFGVNFGKRMTGAETSTAISVAKRWDGSAWVNLTIAKRWNGSAWVDFTN